MPRKPGRLRIAASTMPELQHSWPDREYDVTKSEVVRWCLDKPPALQAMFNALNNTGGIVYDEATGKWKGVPLVKPVPKYELGPAEYNHEGEWVPCVIVSIQEDDHYLCQIEVNGQLEEMYPKWNKLRPAAQYPKDEDGTMPPTGLVAPETLQLFDAGDSVEYQIRANEWIAATIVRRTETPGWYICRDRDNWDAIAESKNLRRPVQKKKEEVELE